MSPARTEGGNAPVDFAFEWLKDFVSQPNHPVGLLILCGAALIEYVFPPFPGDMITLFGSSVLVTRYHWNAAVVFAVLLAGSQLGAMVSFHVGKKLANPPDLPNTRRRLDRLVKGFARHGPAYLVINRFVPVFRPLFFIAAGMAHMRPWPVFIFSAISSALWNGLLMTLGILVGVHFETLVDWARNYTLIALGLLVLVILTIVLVKRRR